MGHAEISGLDQYTSGNYWRFLRREMHFRMDWACWTHYHFAEYFKTGEFSNSLQHMTYDIPAWSTVILVTVLMMFCLISCTSCNSIAFSLYLKEACPISSKGGWVYYKDHIATNNKPLMKFTTELLSLNTSSTPDCDLPVGYDHEWPLLFQTCMCPGSSYLKKSKHPIC